MATARELWPDHPEVLMFQRRCLGAAEELFAKAKAMADAGDDKMAVKVGHPLHLHVDESSVVRW